MEKQEKSNVSIVDEQVVLEITPTIKLVISAEKAKALGIELMRAGVEIKSNQRLKKWTEQREL